MIKVILYILIAVSIAFGVYKMLVDDQKSVGYVSFIFAVLVFLLTLIPTNDRERKVTENQTTEEFITLEPEYNETTEEFLTESQSDLSMQVTECVLSNTESEPNNEMGISNVIEVNKQYQGKLDTEGDVDYYKFKVYNSGKIGITFLHDKIDSGERLWEIRLIDGQADKEIIRYNSVGGIAKGESYKARISEGEYYIKINQYYYSDKQYMFQVDFLEEFDTFEKEINDQIDTANNIIANENYIGNLQTDKDVDYFKLSIINKGKISFSFEHAKIDSGDRLWEVYLLDGVSDNIILTLFSIGREAILNSDSARIPPGDYYIKIKPYYYSNDDYKFKINFESESNMYESENNNEYGLANEMMIGQTYTGNIQTKNDVDYYCIIITEMQDLTLYFDHWILESNDCYWEIYFVDGNNDNDILSMKVRGSDSSVSLTAENIMPGKYYIKVIPYYFNNADYTISVYKQYM